MSEFSAFAGKLVVVKIGGNSLADDPAFLPQIVAQLVQLQREGVRLILVHGGGPQIDRALREESISTAKAADGRRITNAAAMTVIATAMEKIRADILAALRSGGSQAEPIGVSPVLAMPVEMNGDRTGRPVGVDASSISALLDRGAIPVLHSIARGRDDALAYNVNADDCALAVAGHLRASRLVLVTNVQGVWGADKQPLPLLTPELSKELIAAGVIAGGMIPKVESAVAALVAGVGGIAIIDGHRPEALLTALLAPQRVGTLIAAA